MRKTVWIILRVITVALALPFLIMKLIGDAIDTLLINVMDWEDDKFRYNW